MTAQSFPVTLSSIPDWLKFVIALGTLLVGLTISWSDLKADLRVETAERITNDNHTARTLEEIKQMMRDEYLRHHTK